MNVSRRQFFRRTSELAALGAFATSAGQLPLFGDTEQPNRLKLGLVTYLWGKDLTLPELISACEQSGVLGIELRTTHAHGVEPDLNKAERQEVRDRFEDSDATLVGIGSNERYDSPNPDVVAAAIEKTKKFIQLSHAVGGSGVKVKGDRFHENVPQEKTIDQVASALRSIGDYADDFNQEIRLEVHGGFSELPIHHRIIAQTDHPRVRTCWNSNDDDLKDPGLVANFELVRPFFGQTAHVRELDGQNYPWDQLMKLFVQSKYEGWILLEARGDVDKSNVAARLKQQLQLFHTLIERAS